MCNQNPSMLQIASRTTGWAAAGYVGAAVLTTVNAPAAATFLGTQTLLTNLAAKILPNKLINDSNVGYGISFVVSGIMAYQITQIVGLPLTIAGVFIATAAGTAIVVSAMVAILFINTCCCPRSFGIGSPELLGSYFIHNRIRNYLGNNICFMQQDPLVYRRSSEHSRQRSISSESSDDSSNPNEAIGRRKVPFASSVESTLTSAETIVLKYEEIEAMTLGVIHNEIRQLVVEGVNYQVSFYKVPLAESIVLRKNESDNEHLIIMLLKNSRLINLHHNRKKLLAGGNQVPSEYVKPWQALCQQLQNK